ncbi:MAG: tRNA 2-thiouridine(34) synthase MnmA [Bacilli bacterium]
MNQSKKTRVMIGLSGGVDSAVAAYLLKEQGYDVIAGFMRNWDALANADYLGNPTLNQEMCPQEVDYQDAMLVAEKLGIPLYRIDFVKEYWDHVFSFFLKEYEKGRTPNPDILCNKYIKFDAFLSFAQSHGASHIAMGHYAKRMDHPDGKAGMHLSTDSNKDQTYFLSQVSQAQLAKTLFPIADIPKEEVRNIAKKLNLVVAEKKDSTGVCFIGERNFREFLKNYIPAQPGIIIDMETNTPVGQHEGVYYYTIGQRKGLGIGGSKSLGSDKWFVVKKDVKQNILYVAQGEDNPYLLSDEITVGALNWIRETPTIGGQYLARFRHRQALLPVTITSLTDHTLTLTFPSAYKAITPGQGAVLYHGDECLGGGLIDQIYYQGKQRL